MAVDNLEVPATAALVPGDTNVVPQLFHYSPMMFVRAMLGIVWSTITHPFSSSVIDLTTGQVYPAEEE